MSCGMITFTELGLADQIERYVAYEYDVKKKRKKGAVNTQMVFIPGQCTETEYQTPYGKFILTVDTKRAEIRKREKEIVVELDYRLSLGGAQAIRNQMKIKVAEL